MYPGHYNLEWLKFKDGTPLVPPRKRGSVARAWQWRERGINPRGQPPNKTVLENIAEDILVQKPLQITSCDLPGFPRSTFLMVFSPDGTKLASTHGNHYIYVSELASGKHVTILKGHPRTPWCIAFHPSHPQLIGSGCLGGQVRVWDIASGGSEVWNVCNETVIASIAFHPREQLLVIATFNELYFWDWSQPAPFTKVSTKNINEKVRYVAFDSLGFKLITGISLWACPANMNSNPLATSQTIPPASGNNSNPGNGSPGNIGNNGNGPGNGGPGNGSNNPRGDGPPRGDDDAPGRPHTPAAAQDMIVNSYQTLVQRYDSLVRNYQRLFMVRHRLINTPPLANTIDRGTDPMEPYPLVSDRHRRRSARLPRADPDNLSINFEPGTSQQQDSSESSSSPTPTPTPRPEFSTMMDSSPSDSASTRNSPGMGVLGFRVPIPGLRHIGFASAFQPPGDERTTRLLPNPFSSTNSNIQPNTSRTSGLFMPRDTSSDPLGRFSVEMRNAASAENVQIPGSAATNSGLTGRNADSLRAVFERAPPLSLLSTGPPFGPPYVPPAAPQSGPPYVPPAAPQSGPPYVPPAAPQSGPPYVATAAPPPLPTGPPPATPPPPAGPAPDAATATSETPTTQTSTYTQNSTRSPDPLDPYRDAHSINESLDLIRDILRDSGTRLLNLITNMSLNILTNSEREDGARVPVQVFTGNLRRDFMASSSDSEGEHPEVNITRTPNATFQEGDNDSIEMEDLSRTRADDSPQSNSSELIETVTNRMTIEIESLSETPSRRGGINVSDRMTFELDQASEVPSREGGINVSLSDDRFRVRTQGTRSVKSNPELTRDETPPPVPIATNNDSELDSSSESSRDSSLLSSPNPSVPSPNASVPSPNPSARDEPQPGPSSAPDGLDPSQPSTSRGHGRHRGNDIPAQAFRRFRMGVTALQKHTLQLANMWLRGDRTTLRELRAMWEDLRRRILALPTFYNRSLLERCMLLSEFTVMPDLPTRQHGRFRRNTRMGDQNSARNRNRPTRARSEESSRSIQLNQYNALNGAGPSTSTASASNPHTVGTTNSSNPSTSSSSNATAGPSSSNATAGPSTSNTNDSRSSRAAANRAQRRRLVRLQQSYLWRGESENRRRDRNLPTFRISQPRRTRNSIMRTVEQNATRHVIRTRAMKILSVMFNMMMMCLEERGLSQLIINMLKTLKKALALTCFMMMSNRNISNIIPPASQSIESADVVRIQNVDHSEPINVDDNIDDPHSLRVIRYDAIADDPRLQAAMRPPPAASSSTQTEDISPVEPLPSPMTNATSQSWSHRLAVQIAAANRNTSSTAKTRKDMYQETRRQKALHRTNPTAHPYIRRRVAPVMSHRIPALRSLPPGRFHPRVTARSPPPEPVPGPSNELPGNRNPENLWQIGRDARENFIRLAHIRLRTAARNRFRRLQTIRLYTPSSVREMFALQDFQGENRTEEAAPPEELENQYGPRRPQFHAMFASEGLLQVNDLPPAAEANANPRLPRIHEYLQPIILAQNAMVVDDEDGGGGGGPPAGLHGNRRIGGMAGLLDAGVISEALPAPSHRVQAWDFTSGAAPDIADSTKNVVVSRCRIHNDASIDISKDGKLLVALLPVPRLRNANWLGEYHVGVYSLDWPRLGQCLHTAVLEQSAVSVALSPTARYLAVGLGSRRFTSSHSRTNIIALLYKLDPLETTGHTGLSPMKELEQYWEHGFTSLNCLRWAPQPGQGLVYANNTGQLIIMS